ncbi:hypothetical protein GOBAR_AA26020 [Gossypium barbadense]|uniref:Protein kinase domain-containing protein n=1 Tax=Gossypium barbadense TaxID=3634 RepID=A0A2P5WU63_GOSBA|nr:hypothetical protein GOBAR_AA26020 [Gossypium barbadense]
MSSNEGGLDKAKLFSSKELEIATDQYNENRILGCGGQGVVYKGMLFDGRIVAVKKSKTVNEGYLEQFINEIFILSQIDHRNIVKLLGCCLETEVPLLVYEFIPNGTLSHLIHDQNEEYPRSWDIRLRIATEIASAISYLHSSASIPIYHRDIKSSNILLDEKFRAKVSDFGTSRSIGIDQTHLTTQVLGTFGYLDPEYFQSSQFTEKSDVYSFGVVIVELLTGKRAISTFGSQEKRGLVSYFMSSMEENHLLDIVDAEIGKDGQKDEVVAVAQLAKRCLNLDGRYRPTMKEVAMELERLRTGQGDYIHTDQIKQAEVVDVALETKLPLLVYEFIPNGTLSHLIHDQNEEYPRSWDIRLRIEAEIAMVIVELVTSKRAISTFGSQEKRGLFSYFMSSMEENHLLDIVDDEIGKDYPKDEVVTFAQLAKRSLNLDERYRPTMKEVAMELERLRTRQGDCIPIDQLKQDEVGGRKSAESWDFTSFSTDHYRIAA